MLLNARLADSMYERIERVYGVDRDMVKRALALPKDKKADPSLLSMADSCAVVMSSGEVMERCDASR